MRIDLVRRTVGMAMTVVLLGSAPLSAAQDKPADNMQILREKIKADKKLLVANNMELTESEAKNFWPVYEQYQKDLQQINRRIATLLDRYAADFQARRRAGGERPCLYVAEATPGVTGASADRRIGLTSTKLASRSRYSL